MIIKIETEIEISNEDIIDVLTTALEGGSNYWYNFDDLSMINDDYTLLTDEVIYSALQGINIPVFDIDDSSNLLGFLSKNTIEQGIKLFIEAGYSFEPDMDADDADILFQYIVLGDIIYG